MSEEIRGSAPVYSAKEVLVEVDRKVDRLTEQVAILVNEQLGPRLKEVEAFKERLIGISTIGAVLGSVGTILSIVTMLTGK